MSDAALDLLARAHWRGNVRELRHVVESAAAMAGEAPTLNVADILEFVPTATRDVAIENEIPPLRELIERAEERAILAALQRTNCDYAAAAALLEIGVSSLYRKISASRKRGGLLAALDRPRSTSGESRRRPRRRAEDRRARASQSREFTPTDSHN